MLCIQRGKISELVNYYLTACVRQGVRNGRIWSQIIADECTMVTDVCRWSQMVADGSRLSPMVVCHEVMSVTVVGAGNDRCG